MKGVPYKCDSKIYKTHYGKGLGTRFVGEINQEGYGLGGFLSSIVRKVIPLALPFLKKTGKTLARKGAAVLKDVVIEKRKLKDTVKRRATEGLDELLDSFEQQGKGRKRAKLHRTCKRKKICSKSRKTRKRGKKNIDIFS